MMVEALLGYFCAHENELTKGKAARGRKLRRFI